ncbi:M15 family metallopeptidase [Cellulomonas oligotrophica]|uniref:D-alanyl-D-alanine dipeptidase n=1 Tax=Cellulomonas oligotrophica TaxID=931536 RepID=A0A7Y9FFX0_9CELL|nr:M15 family metallopeptidase [Cellulomonas oligotrophica]NYD86247.1 D-alanyl-D-alanine dipeptidase [Cellulomonas oligotrophica]GIG34426.1 D-alanyl-D-alanine dipeptidase [Cellulomonas oligotrophica]
MTILLSDPRVAAVPVHDDGEPLVALDPAFGPPRALVREGVALRLAAARDRLPAGVALRVLEGHRPVEAQRAIIARYSAQVAADRPGLGAAELARLTSRFVAPVAVAPHVAGSAVDLTLVDDRGQELDMGTPVDATPEQSGGRCFTAARDISAAARAHRALLGEVLGPAGLVNYPTEWWHWSWGDRYWALLTGADAALHGPVDLAGVAA